MNAERDELLAAWVRASDQALDALLAELAPDPVLDRLLAELAATEALIDAQLDALLDSPHT